MSELIGLGVGLVFFLCTITAYTLGLRHGRELSKGIMPRLDINPIRPILKVVERAKEEKRAKELGEELADVMSYTKESALKAVKEERQVI